MTNQIEGYIQKWIDNPDGGGRFLKQRDAIVKHDPECASLEHAWLPRKGGVACPSDLSYCDAECGVTFFNEGVYVQIESCEGCWFCVCCAKDLKICPCGEEAAINLALGRA
jgi:hypothetical protein